MKVKIGFELDIPDEELAKQGVEPQEMRAAFETLKQELEMQCPPGTKATVTLTIE